VHALGYRTDAPEISAASDMVVLPTTKREGLSRAILEAMAYGRPAVVSDTGGNAELVADGESGFVVPPSDPQALAAAISSLAGDPELRERMGAAARQRITELFSVEQGVAATLRVYRMLAEQKVN
jgi:glycosyltransferase involved in cell wall biosynthesis